MKRGQRVNVRLLGGKSSSGSFGKTWVVAYCCVRRRASRKPNKQAVNPSVLVSRKKRYLKRWGGWIVDHPHRSEPPCETQHDSNNQGNDEAQFTSVIGMKPLPKRMQR